VSFGELGCANSCAVTSSALSSGKKGSISCALAAFLTGLNSGIVRVDIGYPNNHDPTHLSFDTISISTAFIGFNDPGQPFARTANFVSINYFSGVGGPLGIDDVRFVPTSATVPDTGSTLMLLSSTLAGLGAIRRSGTH
jgi:hypothetical protein